MGANRLGISALGRRAFVQRLAALLAGMASALPAAASTRAYPQTVAALARALQRETDAHRRYVAFAAIATREGYAGIAYMFTAFAVSEGIHAHNFRGLIGRLGGETGVGPTAIDAGGTKQNLIKAVDDEIDSIDSLYPGTLERIRPEAHVEAIALVRFAWASEQQHRDVIQRIRRYSPLMFERVAKAIDDKTGLYFVCSVCGSTRNAVPDARCPICDSASTRYRQVPIPG